MARAFSHGQTWTAAEEARLRELYATTKSESLSELFCRSKKAVNSRAKVLGLQKAIGHGGKVVWTRKMDQQLRTLYPETLTRLLAPRLGVSRLAAHGAEKPGVYLDYYDFAVRFAEPGMRWPWTLRYAPNMEAPE